MRIIRPTSDSLVTLEEWRLLRLGCTVGLVLLPIAVYVGSLGTGSMSRTRMTGVALGSALLLVVGGIVDDRRFEFDGRRKIVTWTRRNWFRSRRGELPFHAITDVRVTTTRSRDTDSNRWYDSHAAVVVTAAGPMPLTSTSSRDKREYEALARTVPAILVSH